MTPRTRWAIGLGLIAAVFFIIGNLLTEPMWWFIVIMSFFALIEAAALAMDFADRRSRHDSVNVPHRGRTR